MRAEGSPLLIVSAAVAGSHPLHRLAMLALMRLPHLLLQLVGQVKLAAKRREEEQQQRQLKSRESVCQAALAATAAAARTRRSA